MEIEELVIESVLRAMLYCMEADMGMEAARATDQYQKNYILTWHIASKECTRPRVRRPTTSSL